MRELEFNAKTNKPRSLAYNLAAWSERKELTIPEEQFCKWLKDRHTLVLLDGLDEINNKDQRKEICKWIKNIHTGLKNACFVMTCCLATTLL